MKLRTSYALKEGGERDFAISTTRLSGDGRVERDPLAAEHGPAAVRARARDRGVASGGARAARDGLHRRRSRALVEQAGDGVFVTGDARRGQSLIVWAIAEGRATARRGRAWLDARRRFIFDSEQPAPGSTLRRDEADDERGPRRELRGRGDRRDRRHEVDAADRPRPVGRPAALQGARALVPRHQPAHALGAARHARGARRRSCGAAIPSRRRASSTS